MVAFNQPKSEEQQRQEEFEKQVKLYCESVDLPEEAVVPVLELLSYGGEVQVGLCTLDKAMDCIIHKPEEVPPGGMEILQTMIQKCMELNLKVRDFGETYGELVRLIRLDTVEKLKAQAAKFLGLEMAKVIGKDVEKLVQELKKQILEDDDG